MPIKKRSKNFFGNIGDLSSSDSVEAAEEARKIEEASIIRKNERNSTINKLKFANKTDEESLEIEKELKKEKMNELKLQEDHNKARVKLYEAEQKINNRDNDSAKLELEKKQEKEKNTFEELAKKQEKVEELENKLNAAEAAAEAASAAASAAVETGSSFGKRRRKVRKISIKTLQKDLKKLKRI